MFAFPLQLPLTEAEKGHPATAHFLTSLVPFRSTSFYYRVKKLWRNQAGRHLSPPRGQQGPGATGPADPPGPAHLLHQQKKLNCPALTQSPPFLHLFS